MKKKVYLLFLAASIFLTSTCLAKELLKFQFNPNTDISKEPLKINFYNLKDDRSSIVRANTLGDMVVDSLRIKINRIADDIHLNKFKLILDNKARHISPNVYSYDENASLIDLGIVLQGLSDGLHVIKVVYERNEYETSFSVDNTPPEILIKNIPHGQEIYVLENGSGLAAFEAKTIVDEKIKNLNLQIIENHLFKLDREFYPKESIVWYEATDNAGNKSMVSSSGETYNNLLLMISQRYPSLISNSFNIIPNDNHSPNLPLQTGCNIPQHIVIVKLFDGLVPGDREAKEMEGAAQLAQAKTGFEQAISILNNQLTTYNYGSFGIIPSNSNGGIVKLFDVNLIYRTPAKKNLYRINDSTGHIESTGFNIRKFLLDASALNNGFKNLFDVGKTSNDMIIYVFDELKSEQDDMETTGETLGFSHLTEGYIFLDSGKIQTIADNLRDLLYAHEIGHILGLEHFGNSPDDLGNMMNDSLVYQGITLEQNQAMAIYAHVCGTPANVLTFRGQSGHFGINPFTNINNSYSSNPTCEGGLIGEDEECEESLYKIGEYCADPDIRPIPTWPNDSFKVCMPDCTCQEIVGNPPPPPTPVPSNPIPVGSSGGTGPSRPEPTRPRSGCYIANGDCVHDSDCGEAQYCDSSLCVCKGGGCENNLPCFDASECPLVECEGCGGAHHMACISGCCVDRMAAVH